MANDRVHDKVGVTMDQVAIISISGWVSGTAGANPEGVGGPSNMTGSLIKSTEQRVVLQYASGNFVTPEGVTIACPSGSMQVIFPKAGNGVSAPTHDTRYGQILMWQVQFEHSGTDLSANSLSTMNNYDVVQYGHTTSSFVFGFQRISGSAAVGVDNYGSSGSFVGAIPQDRINPSSPACTWNLFAVARNTDRKA